MRVVRSSQKPGQRRADESPNHPQSEEDNLIRKTATTAVAALALAAGFAQVASAATASTAVRYDSTPIPGTVSVPSMGPEAYALTASAMRSLSTITPRSSTSA